MIKKGLLSLFVGFLGLIGFSNGVWTSYDINTSFTDPIGGLNTLSFLSKGNFLTQFDGVAKNMLYFGKGSFGYFQGENLFFWDREGYLYYYLYGRGSCSAYTQGRINNFSICDSFYGAGTPQNCVAQSYDKALVSSFLSQVSASDIYQYDRYYNRCNYGFAFCLNSSSYGKSICFCGGSNSSDWRGMNCTYDTTTSLEIPQDISFSDFDISLLGYSPAGGGGGGNNGGTVSNSFNNSSAIEYLESVYNFNSSLCYVGIDDLSVNYGGAGSFIQGGGKTIFELFDYINGTSESVSNVGVWINSRIINYQQWFDNYGKTAEPTYLTNYSNGQISVYYDNLTFPFLNKPAGLYFMANNLYDSSVSSNGNMGQELAIYCDLKLNGENASPIPENSDLYKNVINYEYFNKNNGNSYYDGSGNLIIYQEPGEDSIFNDDYFGNFSGDYSDYFKGYEEIFNNFTSRFNIREYRTTGIIPGYILFFFALIILFKLIRK